MIRIRSAYPAPKSAPAGPGAGQSAWPQHFRELEIDHDGCTSILRIVPRIEPSLTAGLPHIGTPARNSKENAMPPELETPDHECGDMQTLVSSTLHLLSAFSASGCPRLAIMIKRHLERLAAHPDANPLVQAQTGSGPATQPASARVH